MRLVLHVLAALALLGSGALLLTFAVMRSRGRRAMAEIGIDSPIPLPAAAWLIMLAWAIVFCAALATLAAAGNLKDTPPEGLPAGYQLCVDSSKQLAFCRIPGLRQLDMRPLQPTLPVRPAFTDEERRHRELMDQLDRIEGAVREGR